ncbi:MAG: hypothetical protein F4018_08550 [Acidobacteria bacterium]|nr:hypothetical protein [Acidobacteriota bacterium]MYH28661.1 hypothetical protein [Acidobacteriota bacterium]MYK88378.1 hypothetical protein [Acidobacteriota bacterium]
MDDDVVDDYVQALADGQVFSPVVVFRADGADLLADGFHRVLAYHKAGRSEIEADVHEGTRDAALWFALGAIVPTVTASTAPTSATRSSSPTVPGRT